ncbi:hypothetical protein [Agrococcus terreus]|uniref:Uncharacterized protein n=1 Tax=Agrococcus terreus TaxID=574649 RepID=A0ABQ2KJ70_9MICO|nr:hypothetical protein [Agrococcus terreus]GGN84314.1 hypothetical protein GCM10010968_15920 [Agrococcus terreus]
MHARPIDPRDQTHQEDEPTYRVYFWDDRTGGLSNDEWELRGADVDEVLAWAEANAHGRSPSVWAVTRAADDVLLVRLRGIDLDRVDASSWPKHAARWTPTIS